MLANHFRCRVVACYYCLVVRGEDEGERTKGIWNCCVLSRSLNFSCKGEKGWSQVKE
uniref:Uncharacterized protein n=1 Tax=Solanum lycopersicum TaxID=4081 RepID=A0A3Q7HM91_SOLLC